MLDGRRRNPASSPGGTATHRLPRRSPGLFLGCATGWPLPRADGFGRRALATVAARARAPADGANGVLGAIRALLHQPRDVFGSATRPRAELTQALSHLALRAGILNLGHQLLGLVADVLSHPLEIVLRALEKGLELVVPMVLGHRRPSSFAHRPAVAFGA